MNINQIRANLNSPNLQHRLKAVAQLKQYNAEEVVPLLKEAITDKEFIVRSFTAMALGRQKTAESYAVLQTLIKTDPDPNVRAEAANSLSLFGKAAIPDLIKAYKQDKNWLVHLSILAALKEMNCPEALFEVCTLGIHGEDPVVQEAAVDGLSLFADAEQEQAALQQILSLATAKRWRLRVRVAQALGKFKSPAAQQALNKLQQDENYRVVGATLEKLLLQD